MIILNANQNEVLAVLDRNIEKCQRDLNEACASSTIHQPIYAWPQYGLGVRLEAGGFLVVQANFATNLDEIKLRPGRVFFNGNTEAAVISNRGVVLEERLKSAKAARLDILNHFVKQQNAA